MYRPLRQRPSEFSRPVVAVRSAAEPGDLFPALRLAVARVDPVVPMFEMAGIAEVLSEQMFVNRFMSQVLTVARWLGLTLGATGVYGVVSYLVSRQTREIAVRIALGAQSSSVLCMVLRRGVILAILGIILGLAGALAVGRIMANVFFGVSTADMGIYAGVVCVLSSVCLLASYLPARRATRVDPMEALRCEWR
ncbi:MAG: FtsX-like permease family protein [Verrucomicrobiales bacterium]|nr:FtsX-like permease family protein [Verrucomicrobiales bacterium]